MTLENQNNNNNGTTISFYRIWIYNGGVVCIDCYIDMNLFCKSFIWDCCICYCCILPHDTFILKSNYPSTNRDKMTASRCIAIWNIFKNANYSILTLIFYCMKGNSKKCVVLEIVDRLTKTAHIMQFDSQ